MSVYEGVRNPSRTKSSLFPCLVGGVCRCGWQPTAPALFRQCVCVYFQSRLRKVSVYLVSQLTIYSDSYYPVVVQK